MSSNVSLFVALGVALLTALGAVAAAVIGSRTTRANGREDRGLRAMEAVLDDHQARLTILAARDVARELAYEAERQTRRELEDRVTALQRDLEDTQRQARETHDQATRVTEELVSLRQSGTDLTLENGQLQKRVDELEVRLARYEGSDGTPISTTSVSLTASTTTTEHASAAVVPAYSGPDDPAPPKEDQ